MAERANNEDTAREFIALGLSQLEAGDAKGAERSVTAALKLCPKANEGWAALYKILENDPDRGEEAQEALKKSTEGVFLETELPEGPVAAINLEDLEEKGPFGGGAGTFRGRILPYETPADGKEELIAKARTAESTGEFKSARDYWERVIEIDPTDTWAWSQYADLLAINIQDYDKAESAYRRAIEEDPTDDWAHGKLGIMLCDFLERVDEGQELLRHAIELEDKEAYYHAWLGWSLYRQSEQLEAGIVSLKAAVELRGDYAWALFHLALATSWVEGGTEEAIGYYRRLTKLNEDDAASWFNLGVLYHDKVEEYRKAVRCFEKASKYIANDPVVWLRIADLYHFYLDQPEKAVKAYQEHLNHDPENDQAWTFLGELQRDELYDDEAAIGSFGAAIALNDQNAEAQAQLGALLAGDPDKYDEACLHLECAIAIDAEYLYAYQKLIQLKVDKKAPAHEIQPLFDYMLDAVGDEDAGLVAEYCRWVGHDLQEIERAIKLYDNALKKFPDDTGIQMRFLIFCAIYSHRYKDMGRYKAYMDSLAEGHSIFAILAYNYYVYIERDIPKSVELIEFAIEKEPDQHLPWHTIAEYNMFIALRFDEAREQMKKAQEFEDNCSALHEHKALLSYFIDKDKTVAMKHMARAKEMDAEDLEEGEDPEGPSDIELAIALAEGDFERVEVGARENIEDDPLEFENYLLCMLAIEHDEDRQDEVAELLRLAEKYNYNDFDLEAAIQWFRAPLSIPKVW